MKHILLGMAALLCAGCSTPYQEMGFGGGVEAQQMTANTYRIVARGNGYTSGTAIQDYALLKAAETTKQAGATHFEVISASDASSVGAVTTPGQATTIITGSTARTTFTPATTHTFLKPGQDAYIRVLTLKPGQPTPAGVYQADEIIQYVGSRVPRG
jgi:hypothetical protein